MKQRDALLVLTAVVIAVAVSAILLAGSLANASASDRAARGPGIFFAPRSLAPPIRTIVEAQGNVPEPLRAALPLQRGLTDSARDAAGYLLVLLSTSAALVLAREQVVNAYRASLGGWRAQLRIVATGLAVIGVGASAAALAWIVFLGAASTALRNSPLGLPAALQIVLGAFSVALVVAGIAAVIGFAAVSWRLGDALLQLRFARRWVGVVPAPLMALLGASLIYMVWQVPYVGVAAVATVLAYALGAVMTARLRASARQSVTL